MSNLFCLKLPKSLWFTDDFRGYKKDLICVIWEAKFETIIMRLEMIIINWRLLPLSATP